MHMVYVTVLDSSGNPRKENKILCTDIEHVNSFVHLLQSNITKEINMYYLKKYA